MTVYWYNYQENAFSFVVGARRVFSSTLKMNMKTIGKWTEFSDMHSGGGAKEKWEYIYIQADLQTAKVIFYNRFGHSPNRVTCNCCGEDYSISESDSLAEITGYKRNCKYDSKTKKYIEHPDINVKYGKYITLDEFLKSKNNLVIYDFDILELEKVGEIPEQGYVWH